MFAFLLGSKSKDVDKWLAGAADRGPTSELWQSWRFDEETDIELIFKIFDKAINESHAVILYDALRRAIATYPHDSRFMMSFFIFSIFRSHFLAEMSSDPAWRQWCTITRIDADKLTESLKNASGDELAVRNIRVALETAFRQAGATEIEAADALEGFIAWGSEGKEL